MKKTPRIYISKMNLFEKNLFRLIFNNWTGTSKEKFPRNYDSYVFGSEVTPCQKIISQKFTTYSTGGLKPSVGKILVCVVVFMIS